MGLYAVERLQGHILRTKTTRRSRNEVSVLQCHVEIRLVMVAVPGRAATGGEGIPRQGVAAVVPRRTLVTWTRVSR